MAGELQSIDNSTISENISFRVGIDIGSTTAKAVVLDSNMSIIHRDYRRHCGKIKDSLVGIIRNFKKIRDSEDIYFTFTGSAGMGIAEKLDMPFIQELIAASNYISFFNPEIKTLIDIGGEDSKIVFFDEDRGCDIRMNSNCAGGTGSFIDQMASIMGIEINELDRLAAGAENIYTIASRCGVFAKTDVQNLICSKVGKEDIAASIFKSLSIQIKNTLLKADNIIPKVAFSGGPLTFIKNLNKILRDTLAIHPENLVVIDSPELLTAAGAAVSEYDTKGKMSLSGILALLDEIDKKKNTDKTHKPLFKNVSEFNNWSSERNKVKAERISLRSLDKAETFLGIDSGSTTTKIILADSRGRIAFDYYARNKDNPIEAVRIGLQSLFEKSKNLKIELNIVASAVCGYGEGLIKSAFGLDCGIVETIAHFRAAKAFEKDVSFILDIGGQDMKAIFVEGGEIRNIEINEACSSGCGSFISTLSHAMDYTIEKFAEKACRSKAPSDLGVRCTVFMNSKVKQSFRNGASIDDISAGLAYSVVNNCLRKVLNISDTSLLGNHIVVQGGTFKNPAVHKAFENILGRQAICPDISELMGAYGAALKIMDEYQVKGSRRDEAYNISKAIKNIECKSKSLSCKGCDNACKIEKMIFENGNQFFVGARCERFFNNNSNNVLRGENFVEIKRNILFKRPRAKNDKPREVVGMPRALNIFENYPFWHKLFYELGFKLVLSDESSDKLCAEGAGSLMSDNICFPAKIVHGHINNLIRKRVDRIFYPMVTFQPDSKGGANNSFNCPIVAGYPDVIRRTVNPWKNYRIQYDTPNITFKNRALLRKSLLEYFNKLGINAVDVIKGLRAAIEEQDKYFKTIKAEGAKILEKNQEKGRLLFVLAGRPYHIDKLINHGIPDMIADMGADLITEDALDLDNYDLKDSRILTQWAFPNRILKAAKWARERKNARLIQLNSFGCGPDTILLDEAKGILGEYGQYTNIIRIDESTSVGSLKLRLRSLIDSINPEKIETDCYHPRESVKVFEKEDKSRTILAPYFSDFHSAYISNPFTAMGYKLQILPKSTKESIEYGLKYTNNEICYPATIVIGDILKALLSGNYNLDEVAVGITQTGGQCRASNYLSLLKKAMLRAGITNVPVVSVSLAKGKLNEQPGFKLNKKTVVYQGILGLMFGDALANLYYATAPRELVKGDALKLVKKYNALVSSIDGKDLKKFLFDTLEKAVEEFNQIKINRKTPPKIGVVGEVYVKNNPFGNNYIVDYLIEQGVEVVMPPLINMFSQWFVNINVKKELNIDDRFFARKATWLLEKYFDKVQGRFEVIMKNFKYYFRHPGIREIADKAHPLINMIHHYFGEGWMIAGDIAYFSEHKINKVVCLQPFGCLANHIVARGIEKAVKELYPSMRIQYIDLDHGMSEVNIHNRLKLLLNNNKNNFAVKPKEIDGLNIFSALEEKN